MVAAVMRRHRRVVLAAMRTGQAGRTVAAAGPDNRGVAAVAVAVEPVSASIFPANREKYRGKCEASPASGGQVRGPLDIFAWVASFEVFALRPTWASYS